MRIVFLSDWFSEQMGYAENCMPKALAALGHDVHVVTSTAQVYATSDFYNAVYEPYLGEPFVDPEVKRVDGFTLHRLPLSRSRCGGHILGLRKKLIELRPDIVQTYDLTGPTTVTAALVKPLLRFKLFTANHTVATVFPWYTSFDRQSLFFRCTWLFFKKYKGALLSLPTSLCYAVTPDAAVIATKFYGIPKRKIREESLGVDTDIFHPILAEKDRQERDHVRNELGVAPNDILCVYSGRFTSAKNPLVLARAVRMLRERGKPYRALFLGMGEQEDLLRSFPEVIVRPFVPFKKIAPYYRAADVGVWPQQESTSQLDAMASGLPVVLSDRLFAVERTDGNGLCYREGSDEDLADVLSKLQDASLRYALGKCGAEKGLAISWGALASRRAEEYAKALMC